MRLLELAAGYGGLGLGLSALMPIELVGFSEIDPDARAVLRHRAPDADDLGDLTAVADWSPYRGVDWLTAGFPCQDVSVAGRQAGIRPGTRSGLWFDVAKVIEQVRPRRILLENVRGLLNVSGTRQVAADDQAVGDVTDDPGGGFGIVLGDLADLGFDAEWTCLRASEVGAPHHRERVFVVAHTQGVGRLTRGSRRSHVRGRSVSDGGCGSAASHADSQGRTRENGDPWGRCETARQGKEGTPVGRGCDRTNFGPYTRAIRQWEDILGRPAPDPSHRPGRVARLSPRFVEWMMGLPDGWVTDVPSISHNAALRILGNGVVPQQVAAALYRCGAA